MNRKNISTKTKDLSKTKKRLIISRTMLLCLGLYIFGRNLFIPEADDPITLFVSIGFMVMELTHLIDAKIIKSDETASELKKLTGKTVAKDKKRV